MRIAKKLSDTLPYMIHIAKTFITNFISIGFYNAFNINGNAIWRHPWIVLDDIYV
jgi:hypothetical protein